MPVQQSEIRDTARQKGVKVYGHANIDTVEAMEALLNAQFDALMDSIGQEAPPLYPVYALNSKSEVW